MPPTPSPPARVFYARDPIALFVEEQSRELTETTGVETMLNPSENGEVELHFHDLLLERSLVTSLFCALHPRCSKTSGSG